MNPQERTYLKGEMSPRHFTENLVKIEDRDVVGLAIPFKLWEEQADVLQAFQEQKNIICLKARQLGLTWLALSFACHQMIYKPGYSVVALSKREDDSKEMARRMEFILKNMPGWLIQEKKYAPAPWVGMTWESTKMSVTIHHPKSDKFPKGQPSSEFKSMTAAKDSGRSFTANLVILDEWAFQQWAEEIYAAAYPTINRPTGGKVIGLSTGKRGTLFERIWEDAVAGRNNFYYVFLPWWTDPRRTKEWYEQTKVDLPNTYMVEYPATPEEAFTVGQGAFFPEWSVQGHILMEPDWYPPKYCSLYRAYDGGYGSNACCKWYAVFPDSSIVAYREYYPHQVTDIEQAKAIKEMSIDPWGNEERIVDTIADPSLWNKQPGSGASTAEVFAEQGVYLSKGNNDLANGWRRLHQWLKPIDGLPALRFTINCANTIRTYPACEQAKERPDDIKTTSEHHAQDVDRYFVMSRPEPERDGKGIMPGSGKSGPSKAQDFPFDDEQGRDEWEDEEFSVPGFYG